MTGTAESFWSSLPLHRPHATGALLAAVGPDPATAADSFLVSSNEYLMIFVLVSVSGDESREDPATERRPRWFGNLSVSTSRCCTKVQQFAGARERQHCGATLA